MTKSDASALRGHCVGQSQPCYAVPGPDPHKWRQTQVDPARRGHQRRGPTGLLRAGKTSRVRAKDERVKVFAHVPKSGKHVGVEGAAQPEPSHARQQCSNAAHHLEDAMPGRPVLNVNRDARALRGIAHLRLKGLAVDAGAGESHGRDTVQADVREARTMQKNESGIGQSSHCQEKE
jgi:hypothetical protein